MQGLLCEFQMARLFYQCLHFKVVSNTRPETDMTSILESFPRHPDT